MGHDSPPSPSGSSQPITNAAFLKAVFPELRPEEYLWCASFKTDPNRARAAQWNGYPARVPVLDHPSRNTYFCVAALKPTAKGQQHRRKETFSRLFVVVLDDAEPVAGITPTWVLETSAPDGQPKLQVGYRLHEPLEDLASAQRLHQALAEAGNLRADRNGNNPVRYVRLPVGCNTKYRPPHPHRLQRFEPDVSISLDRLIQALGLSRTWILDGESSGCQPNTATWIQQACKLAWDAARRTLDDPARGRHAELFRLGAYAARDGLPLEALDVLLDEFARRMRPTNTQGEVAPINIVAERRTLQDGFERGRRDRSQDLQRREAPTVASREAKPSDTARSLPPNAWGSAPLNVLGEVSLINAARIPIAPIRWLWPGWLAAGKIHVLAGAPGTGKTTVAMALAATLSLGGRWPDGERAPAGNVMIWSGEDDPKDTLVPRLVAAGANLSRIDLITGYVDTQGTRTFDPARDTLALDEHIATLDTPPALLILDPIVSAVGGDSHKNAEVRRGLQPLVDLAMLRGCAVMGISHFSKGSAGREPVERVTGSLAFGALARIVLVTARQTESEGGGRLIARGKSNIGPDTGGFAYDLEVCDVNGGIETTRVLWGQILEGSARDLLGRSELTELPEEQTATREAMDWLADYLRPGPAKAKDVQREAREAGISEKALRSARERLGVKPTKSGFSQGWRWELHREDAQDALVSGQVAHPPEEGIFADGGHLRAKDRSAHGH
ncbi:AAA ATPase [Thiorhodococcus drewsii AZ1]|uniref:AAA ATPase n=1 Tax=Thiorhodococcus drewsii AZ1 TaxID=765913 RepID=G2DYI9_9GAMM|nr:AAA family ATPase [Thiorhodococcus drewsii]EGV32616.1 AAA ATPase [Thiorhodococcus drewsii AZ1]